MLIRTFKILLLLLICLVNTYAQGQSINMHTPNPQAEKLAQETLAKMTLKQKVYEMSGNGFGPLIKGFLFHGRPLPLTTGGNKKLNIPPILFTDGPRGVITARSTVFPVTMARGASWDVDLEKRVGEVMGIEARAAGANYSGAVCINLLRHPGWGRAQETYGEDPYLLGTMGGALVKGIQQHNVVACIKHFAMNSIENSRFVVNVNTDERTLREVYLPHFKMCIDSGAASVMSAYNRVRGEYCGENYELLTKILRHELGFKGTVSSDWLFGLRDGVKGIKAGMNIEMPRAKYYSYARVKGFLKHKEITENDIDSLVLPTLTTKFNMALAQANETRTYTKADIATAEHKKLALEVAEQSAVLLKNDDHTLPLNKKQLHKIALVGSVAFDENQGDHGSSWLKPEYVISPYQGLKNYLADGSVQLLTAPKNDTATINKICREADVVIVCAGLKYYEEGEFVQMKGKKRKSEKDKGGIGFGTLGKGGDRISLELKQRDLDIIDAATAANKKVIVCLTGSGAFVMESWKNKVSSILMTFYNGMEGGNALAHLLFGDVNPSGKLPFTIPVKETDLPHFDPYADTVEYGYYHGYTLFDKKKSEAAFPFGFGLSYSQFGIYNLKVENKTVNEDAQLEFKVSAENLGKVAGAEVLQVYVGFEHSAIDRPVKLLRAFKKIYLQPGEKETLKFQLPVKDLAYYDTASKTWRVEKMQYSLQIGNSSEHILQRTVFEVK